jgi:hypothetical protein
VAAGTAGAQAAAEANSSQPTSAVQLPLSLLLQHHRQQLVKQQAMQQQQQMTCMQG